MSDYSTATKADMMIAVKDKVRAGSEPAFRDPRQARSGTLEIGTAAMAAVLAVFTISPTGGVVVDNVWTPELLATTLNAIGSGTAAAAQIKDADGNVIVSGMTCGVTAEDVVLASAALTTGNPVTVNSATVTHA